MWVARENVQRWVYMGACLVLTIIAVEKRTSKMSVALRSLRRTSSRKRSGEHLRRVQQQRVRKSGDCIRGRAIGGDSDGKAKSTGRRVELHRLIAGESSGDEEEPANFDGDIGHYYACSSLDIKRERGEAISMSWQSW